MPSESEYYVAEWVGTCPICGQEVILSSLLHIGPHCKDGYPCSGVGAIPPEGIWEVNAAQAAVIREQTRS